MSGAGTYAKQAKENVARIYTAMAEDKPNAARDALNTAHFLALAAESEATISAQHGILATLHVSQSGDQRTVTIGRHARNAGHQARLAANEATRSRTGIDEVYEKWQRENLE